MVMLNQPLGPWRPDLPELNNPGCTMASNVLPGIGCYEPVGSAALYMDATLPSRPTGAISIQDRSGNPHIFVGTSSDLHKIDGVSQNWLNVGKSGGYTTPDTERWKFCEYGSQVIGTNYVNAMQTFDVNADLKFTDLTTLVRAKTVTTVRDFVVAGNTVDTFDNEVPYRVRWSAFGNPYDWNFSLQTMSDFQDIIGGGAVQSVIGGEQGIVLMERSIWSMTFVGAPLVWQFDEIKRGIGCRTRNSVAVAENVGFFLSDDGFYAISGGSLSNIGEGKVNRWFFENANLGAFERMTACADPERKLIYWQFVSADAQDDVPDRAIIYNYQTGEWSVIDTPRTTLIFNAMTLSTAFEELDRYGDFENIPAPLDSTLWTGGALMLWSLDDTGKVYTFTGVNLTGVLETGEQHLSDALNAMAQVRMGTSDRSIVTGVRPVVYGSGDVFARVGSKVTAEGEPSFTPMVASNPSTGIAYFRKEGRYFRFRVVMSGTWRKATSIEIDAVPAGFR